MNWQINSLLQDAINNFRRNNFSEAKILLFKILDIEPKNFDALNIIGVINGNENNHLEALNFFKKAQKIRPDYNLINYNLAKSFSEIGKDIEAIKYYEIAIKLDKNHLGSLLNFGKSLHQLKRYDEALDHYDQAIKLKPDFVDSYYNKALTKLCLGDYEEGWNLYKYRWKRDTKGYRYCDSKLLDNIIDLKNKKILVWHEQGFGDTIMFSRYLNQLIDIRAVIIFEVQQDLESFFRSQFRCKIVNKVSPSEFFDFHVPLLDLPKLFNTSLDNIPFNRSYLKVEHKKKKNGKKNFSYQKKF